MNKLSPQKEYLLSFLRDKKWHCGREWAGRVKDDRTRFCELEPYMAQRGYEIASESCRGSVCGRAKCPLNKRKAVKLGVQLPHVEAKTDAPKTTETLIKEGLVWFENLQTPKEGQTHQTQR